MTENVPAWVTILTKLFLLPSNYKQKKKIFKNYLCNALIVPTEKS